MSVDDFVGYCNACGAEYRCVVAQVSGFCSECDVVDLSKGKKQMQREPIVKIFKDRGKGGNGAFAIATTAHDAGEFLREAALEIAALDLIDGDAEFTLDALLPQVCAVWAKLNGYKSDSVHERRVLIVGEPNPESHMDCLNMRQEALATT
jgi:hypothetical protein